MCPGLVESGGGGAPLQRCSGQSGCPLLYCNFFCFLHLVVKSVPCCEGMLWTEGAGHWRGVRQVATVLAGPPRRALSEGPGTFMSDRSPGDPRAESGQGPPPFSPKCSPGVASLGEGQYPCAVDPFLLAAAVPNRGSRWLGGHQLPAHSTGAPGVLAFRVPDPYDALLWPLEVWAGQPGGPGVQAGPS